MEINKEGARSKNVENRPKCDAWEGQKEKEEDSISNGPLNLTY